MRKHFFTLTVLFCTFLLTTTSLVANNAPSYIERFKDIAIREMHRSGVPASITLAQAIIESGWGNGDIAKNSNNYFGIKCKDYWTGPTYYAKDDDIVDGKLIKSCFRAYKNIESSFVDHSDFLKDNPRYKELFTLSRTDYKAWAKGLKECGYATNEAYATMLIERIEKYGLNKFDTSPNPIDQVPNVSITKPNKTNSSPATAAPGFVIPGFPAAAVTPTTTAPAPRPIVETPVPVSPIVVAPEIPAAPVFEMEEETYDIPSPVTLPDDYERASNRKEEMNSGPLYLSNTTNTEVTVQVIPEPEVGEPYEAVVPKETVVVEEVTAYEEATVYEETTVYEDVYTTDEVIAEPAYVPAQPYQQPLPPATPEYEVSTQSPAPKPEAIIRMSYTGEREAAQLSRRPRVSSSARR